MGHELVGFLSRNFLVLNTKRIMNDKKKEYSRTAEQLQKM